MATGISKMRFRPKDHSNISQCPRSAYTYKPLQTTTSIRVLRISYLDTQAAALHLDDLANVRIKASLVEVDLNDDPVFNALSYTWGDPTVCRFKDEDFLPVKDWYCQCYSIKCDGQEVTVGANLMSCLFELQYLRSCGSSPVSKLNWKDLLDRPIWIDALCINQNDPDEKATQIPLMGRIYSQAKHTVAYLGSADDASVTAMTFIQSFVQAIDEYRERAPDGGVGGLSKGAGAAPHLTGDILLRHKIPVMPGDAVPHIYAFCNRAWFMRTWVMQEIALSKHVTLLCGGMSMDLWDMRSFYWHTSEITGLLQIPTVDSQGNLEDHRDGDWASLHVRPDKLHCREGQDKLQWFIWTVALHIQQQLHLQKMAGSNCLFPRPLSQLIAKFRLTGAADPRDRIYGILSLEGDGWFPRKPIARPPLDYSKPLADVYVEWTRYILEAEQDLAYLSLANSEFDRQRGDQINVPSWVPNLVVPLERKRPCNLDVLGIGSPFSTTRAVGLFHISFPDDSTLKLRGRRIGSVLEVAGFEGDTDTIFDHAHLLLNLPTRTWVPNPQPTKALHAYNLMSVFLEMCTPEVCDTLTKETEERAKGGTFQSRQEVYWRTLLMDQCNRRHPASKKVGPIVTEQALVFLADCLLESIKEPGNTSLLEKFLYFLDIWVKLHNPGELRPAEEFTEEDLTELVAQLDKGPIDSILYFDDELEQFIGARSDQESYDYKLKHYWLLPLLEKRGFIMRVDGASIHIPNIAEVKHIDQALEEIFQGMGINLGNNDQGTSLERAEESENSGRNVIGRPPNVLRARRIWYHEEEEAQSSTELNVDRIDRKDVWNERNNSTARKTLIRLGNGLLGLADEFTQIGDEVWALAGSRVPFTLRKENSAGSAEPRYRLIGDAYVHGVMHGDVVEEDKMGDVQFVHII